MFFLLVALKSQAQKDTSFKTLKVELNEITWDIYFRNMYKLKEMAGRNVSSELLLSTKDTIQAIENLFIEQLKKQLEKK